MAQLTGIGGSGGGGYQYAGFDFNQDAANRDTGKSMKYAFADLSRQAAERGVPQPHSKEEAEQWFNDNIRGGLDALGYTVTDVNGDKFTANAREGMGTFDFLQDAGGANPMLAWQLQDGSGGPMGNPMEAAILGTPIDPTEQALANELGIDTSSPLWRQLLDALMSGQDPNALPQQQAQPQGQPQLAPFTPDPRYRF